MKLKTLSGAVVFALMAASLSAKAEVVYQFTTAGANHASVGTPWTPAGYTSLWLYQEGTGADQSTKLLYYVRDAQGFGRWQGEIPASAVTMTGVSSMHVEVDTCAIAATSGCRVVNVTWGKTPGQAIVGSFNQHTADDGTIYQSAGAITNFSASAVGTVGSITVDGTPNASIGTSTNVTVTVTTP